MQSFSYRQIQPTCGESECFGIRPLARLDGSTALGAAALNSHLAVVRCLIEDCGALTRVRHLFAAAEAGYFETLRCLVTEFGADDNREMQDEATTILYFHTLQH